MASNWPWPRQRFTVAQIKPQLGGALSFVAATVFPTCFDLATSTSLAANESPLCAESRAGSD
jgi:hypothetical protein